MYANSKFQRLSKHIIQELLLSILERYTPGKQFSLRSGHLYFYTIQSLRTVYFSVLSNNLSNWCHEQFFARQHYTRRIQSSADGTSRLMTSSLTCLWAFSRASVLTHQSTCGKSNQFTNLQTHSGLEGILSNYICICLFRKKAFQFELLLELLFTVCQTPSVNFDMSNLGPTVTHTHKNWANHEMITYILVTLMDIRTSFCALICKRNIPINGLADVLARCNAD